jgi:acyl carrier protein/NAD(P)-dependent dehydrogenase (short-subunit alcohol dehydrogenase family)
MSAAPKPATVLAPLIRELVESKAPVQAVAPEPAKPPKPAPGADPVRERVLALVAEKTGYPVDMLALDLDLEADLGIDTVKQAEVFSAIRETYSIPREANLKLRDFPTLSHVIQFVLDRRPDAVPSAPAAVSEPQPSASRADNPVREKVLEIVAGKTGYPKDMLDLDLDLEADLGIDTVKQAEVFATIREAYGIPREANLKLRDFPTLSHVIQFVIDRRPDAVPSVPEAVSEPQPSGNGADNSIREKVLEIVAEKTGYPKDMLDLDLDLEADLGVDTVKQAEVFATIREVYNIPREADLKLRDFPTLSHVIQFVHDRRPDVVPSVPEAASEPGPSASGDDDPIREKVLEIVAEKTGYPKDMLDLDLDLEADLGIDTVKQAEMFAAVRAAFNIPREENLKLRDFPTLTHVIRFAHNGTGPAAAPAPENEKRAAPPALVSLDAAERIPRRVPVPMLRPPLAVCKPTGVALGAGRRVVIVPDQSGTGEALAGQLRTTGIEVLWMDNAADTDSISTRLKEWLAAGPVHGVYWLSALDSEDNLNEMDLAAWREALSLRVKSLYAAMRILYDQQPFLVSATRLGGRHGYDEAGALAPLGGAVVGFTKTYKRERMDALVKAVDFEPDRAPYDVAEILLEETVRDPGAVEIGYQGGLRWTIGLQEQPAADGQPGLKLDKDSVFVITGAAGSIVSAISADLAAASGGTFYLLDLVPEPDPGDPDLERFTADKEGLKRDLFARIQARGERATPALVEKELAVLERAQAAWSAISAVRAAGGTAHYFAVNLTDADAVAGVISQVRERSGRIDVLLHAAGLERSRFLPDKDPREFNLVFDVKADGWFNLLHAIGDMPVGATVAFSSIAGRFGNAGQADYSAANDLLCKLTSGFRTTRPATRGIVIDWTAWSGIGMASRGSIPKMMELAGIDMLPPEAGIPLIRRELTAGATRGEIVIGQRLGILLNEWDETGGLDNAAADAQGEMPRGPMIGTVAGMSLHHGLTIETTLDPAIQPFLYDHRIDGTAVLPGVMGIEAFAEAALLMLPGWRVEAVEKLEFLAPFKFYRNEPRTLSIEAKLYSQGESVLADCRLLGRRTLPNQAEPQVTTHFTGHVRLAKQAGELVDSAPPGSPAGAILESAAIYDAYFHGPAYQVLERAWLDGRRIAGQMRKPLPVHHHPPERPALMTPRLIELCFQTAGIWEMSVEGSLGLPNHIDRVCVLRPPASDEAPLYAVVTPHPDGGCFDAEVVDSAGRCYARMSGYRTVPFSDVSNAESLKAMHAVA